MNEYTATVEYDLIGREWCIRVRYVKAVTNGRKSYASFILVPHNGKMFGAVCDTIEQAIAKHREGKLPTRAVGYI